MKLLLNVFLFVSLAVAQSTDAVLSGTVMDASGASIPGSTVTALNVNTGVAAVVQSNSSGVYQFAALPPGEYRISAEKPGFKKMVLNATTLRTGDRLSQNLSLEIGVASESVEVTANAEAVNYLTSSQGGLLSTQRILDLPVSGRNVMDLVLTQPGLVSTSNGVNINGARVDLVNITLDGTNIIDNFINESLGNVMIFPSVDRVEEVKVITSPADAEYGRGSGQIQLISRSGTNQYHGSVFDSLHNTAFNANSWSNNRNGVPKNVLVENQTGARLDGPIKKNKTFFFVLFEGNINRTKSSVTATTLTDTARQGIYRFYPGVQNANANANNPVVDVNGNPVTPRNATGGLQSVSLFGLDPNRLAPDTTGIVAKNLALLPAPNNFTTGDGLNTAGFLWRRGASDDIYSLNLRLDHNFNQSHRLSVSYNRDAENAPNNNDAQPLPSAPAGDYQDHATVGSIALVSTLRPNLVSEARAGVQRNNIQFLAPWTVPGASTAVLPSLKGQPYLLSLGVVTSPIGTGTAEDPQGRIAPVYQLGEKISWLKGRHAIKAGLEWRSISTNEFVAFNVMPRITLGVASSTGTQNITTIPGIGANGGAAGNLLATLAGSVSGITQNFYSPGGANPQYVGGQDSQHTWRTREWGTYIQDDIKLRSNLTLNIGMRWDYYGVPYEAGGRMVGLVGGSPSIFGLSGTDLGALFHPGNMPGSLSQFQLIGKNSPHPEQSVWAANYRNFAPAIGLSWSLPWLGVNKTVLRAGYGISYSRDPLVLLSQLYGFSAPGLANQQTLAPPSYQSLVNASVPLTPVGTPLTATPVNDNNSSTQTYLTASNGLKTPYIQNWNVSLGRELVRGLVLDVRYVGSKGTKLLRGTNIDEVNIFENGILNAFQITEAGGNSPLLTQVFKGLNISGAGVVDGVNVTGSDAVRKNSTLQAYLTSNNVGGFANFLAYNTFVTGIRGGLLKNGGLPANFVVANPQFGAADLISNTSNSTYHSLQVEVNKRFAHGFQLQASYVRSKALGEYDGNQQSQVTSFLTLRNERLDKRLLSFDTPNVWRTSGVWDLPFGPDRKLFGGSHGVLARIAEKWQTSVIFNKLSGAPTSFSNSGGATFNGLTPQSVALGALPTGSVHIDGNNVAYFTGLTQVPDPSINNMPANLQGLSSLLAIQGANGQILLEHPTPGNLGTLSQSSYRGLGSFTLNMQVSKSVLLNTEHNITLKFRADAINLLNKPIWNTPNLNIDSTSFGLITGASGTRNVILGARVEF